MCVEGGGERLLLLLLRRCGHRLKGGLCGLQRLLVGLQLPLGLRQSMQLHQERVSCVSRATCSSALPLIMEANCIDQDRLE